MTFEGVLLVGVIALFVVAPFAIGYTSGDGTTPSLVALAVLVPLGTLQWVNGEDLRIFGLFAIAAGAIAPLAAVAGSRAKRTRRGPSPSGRTPAVHDER